MAAGDYRACDLCGHKCFYDANLYYGWEHDDNQWSPEKVVEEDGVKDPYGYALGHLGSWAVLCHDCAKEHTAVVMRRGDRERLAALNNILQPLLQDDVEDLVRELRWMGGPIAHEAAQLLEDTLEQAKRHGVIDDGSDQDAGSENEWNRATPLGSLAEATRARGQQR